jgi:hypothetical protein
MPLIDLKTNLKSLKYGFDLQGGGSSQQPFVEKPLPSDNESTPGASPDYILRQGVLKRIVDDETRFFKYFTSTKGLAFIAKQNILSLTSVRTQASQGPVNQGVYLPTSTSAQLAANPFGGHLNFLGADPTGLLGGIRKYSDLVNPPLGVGDISSNKNNRLIQLHQVKSNYISVNPLSGISNNPNLILSYQGGPGAVEGVGKTNIKRYVNTLDLGKTGDPDNITKTTGNSIVSGVRTYTQEDLLSQIKTEAPGIIRQDFRKTLRDREGGIPSFKPTSISEAPDYLTKNWENRTNAGNPGIGNYSRGNSYTKGRGTALDKINALPIYQSKNGKADDGKPINDLIKFRIGVVDNDKPSELTNYIHFRAFIDNFSDSYGTQWTGERYPGRGEEFFRYSGFTRGISLSFTVAAQSKQELIPMYKKLNYLASSTMNDYSPSGYMRAPFIKLTIGGYLYEQFGFLKSINYGWEMKAPFEIGVNDGVYKADKTTQNYTPNTEVIYNDDGNFGDDTSVKELPHVIRVTGFEFQPIYNFLPKRQSLSFGDSGEISSEGDEHYIALQSDNNNWF